MSVRSRMVHRAAVSREVQSGTDPFGNPVTDIEHVYGGDPLTITWNGIPLTWNGIPLNWGSAASTFLPCYVQEQNVRTVTPDGLFLSVSGFLMLAPLGVDLRAEDAVTVVENKREGVLFAQRLRVTAPPVRRETHLELTLEAYT